jgi:hypothetical protein
MDMHTAIWLFESGVQGQNLQARNQEPLTHRVGGRPQETIHEDKS